MDSPNELHYITPIVNLGSIARLGLLCHEDAKRVSHESVALAAIQDTRAKKCVPGGLPLHRYVNLYFHARNPMMYKRKGEHLGLAVLRLDGRVVQGTNVVIADGNAASRYTGFWPAGDGLKRLDARLVYAEDWRDADELAKWRKASAKCAEVLVPKALPAANICGVYVSCVAANAAVQALGLGWPIQIDAHLFFQG